VGCAANDIHIGMSLRVRFEQVSREVHLPRFEPW
jgi:hypothetical protein